MAITVTGLTVSETYRIGFVMARRGNYNAHLARTFTLTMGGQNLGVYSPMTTTWEQALTAAVVANAASLQLVLEAGAEPGIDSMALIDDVAVMPAHPHAARAMGNGNSFEYDANGNMTVRREKLDGISYVYTQTWTVDNRLASVIRSDVTGTILATTTIGYDGDGVRVKKTDPSGATYYLGTVEVLITGTTQLTTSYYAFGGAMVAMRTTATATLTYLHGDHLGSTSLTTNASGQKVSEQRYKPYGEVRWSSGAGMPTDFTFTGQRAGPANYVGSLMDYNARFFSPALGRFVSADTIVPEAGNPATFNRYMYVLGNPIGLRDPSGHAQVCAQQGNLMSGATLCAEPATGATLRWETYLKSEFAKSEFGRELLAKTPDLFDHVLWDDWLFSDGASRQSINSAIGKIYQISLPSRIREAFGKVGSLQNTMDFVLVAHEIFHAFQRMSDPNRDKEFTTIQLEREATAASFIIRWQAFGHQPPPGIAPIFAGTGASRAFLTDNDGIFITKLQYFLARDGTKQGGNLMQAFTVDLGFSSGSVSAIFAKYGPQVPPPRYTPQAVPY